MAEQASFICRFPPHARSVVERLGDTARERGLLAWTAAHGNQWEIRFEGSLEHLRAFAAEIGFRDVTIAVPQPRGF